MDTKLRKTANTIIKLLVVAFTFVFLYDQLVNRHDLENILPYFSEIYGKQGVEVLLLLVALLLLVNLSLETYKWKFVISKLEDVPFFIALKAVFAGMAVSMFMPNRVGDYLGRVFILKRADRLQAILITILGSLAQLVTTLLFGIFSAFFYYPIVFDISIPFHRWIYSGLIVGGIILGIILVFGFLHFNTFSLIIKWISGRGYKRIRKYTNVFLMFHFRELLWILVISIARYLVFSLQFFLLLQIFQIPIAYFPAMMLIGMVYLFMTGIPTIALTEFGIRSSVSITIFEYYYLSTGAWNESFVFGIAAASSLLWVINLVLPAIVGIVFIFSLRFIRKDNVD